MQARIQPDRLCGSSRARTGFARVIRGIRPTLSGSFPFPRGLLARRNRCGRSDVFLPKLLTRVSMQLNRQDLHTIAHDVPQHKDRFLARFFELLE
jgi:hypothetical protein